MPCTVIRKESSADVAKKSTWACSPAKNSITGSITAVKADSCRQGVRVELVDGAGVLTVEHLLARQALALRDHGRDRGIVDVRAGAEAHAEHGGTREAVIGNRGQRCPLVRQSVRQHREIAPFIGRGPRRTAARSRCRGRRPTRRPRAYLPRERGQPRRRRRWPD